MRHYFILISLLFFMPLMAFAELKFGNKEIEINSKPSDEVVSFVFQRNSTAPQRLKSSPCGSVEIRGIVARNPPFAVNPLVSKYVKILASPNLVFSSIFCPKCLYVLVEK